MKINIDCSLILLLLSGMLALLKIGGQFPFCEAVCETCGDDPEMLTIAFETKSGERYSEYYDYFGLPNILEALGKWDKQYGMDNETTGRQH